MIQPKKKQPRHDVGVFKQKISVRVSGEIISVGYRAVPNVVVAFAVPNEFATVFG